MAKRTNESEELVPERAIKKAKKEKETKHRHKKAAVRDVDDAAASQDVPALGDGVNGEETVEKELSKEERKAIRRAKKEAAKQSGDVVKDSGYSSPATKEEKKALKRALKAEKKEKKARRAKTDGEADANGTTTSPDANGAVAQPSVKPSQSAYLEHAELSALPQTEIDKFVADLALSIEDPLNQPYRPITTFKYLPVKDEADRAPFASFSSPTPIQSACWPYLLAGRDVIGVAETGSGKTLAFGLPCIRHIESLSKKQRQAISACIVSPTRELAMQIYEQMTGLAKPANLKVTCVYGGVQKDIQREMLSGTNILVATPGRLNDFIQEGAIDLSKSTYLVLDEADRMLDKGFEDDVRKIISQTSPTGRQTLMFTATWPQSVRNLASTFMTTPVKVTIGDNASGELRANTRISQEVEVIEDWEKQGRLIELLKQYQSGKNKNDRILVFCLYKKEATRIEEFIRRRGFPVAGIHGDLNQQKRTESLDAFKRGKVPCLVATDVAARGLDIPAVKVVINVTFPLTVEDYVHRIGRTGRAGQSGKAITLFTTNEKALSGALINVLKAANQPVPEELMKFGTTVKKKAHEAYGAFYKDLGAEGEMKKATKITFD
ncbi:RNA-dependent ATPase [Saxophila tyrrhenica]|uniref:RNA helicase n=1 Tax=Saxophila tyrrhenica TaxID=1690608 RepID=A0AAV9P738_9PEZI|nr:RNA-dependent ATPase [Saxophila tyrrhenica]